MDPLFSLDDLPADPAAAASALTAVGIEPAGLLAGALVHAGTDILLAATVARSLPAGADFRAVAGRLVTLSTPQPLPVLRAQSALLQAILLLQVERPAGVDKAPDSKVVTARLEQVLAAVQAEIEAALDGLATNPC